MAKNTSKQKIKKKPDNEKSLKNLQIQPWECDSLAVMSMEEASSISLSHSSGWGGMH